MALEKTEALFDRVVSILEGARANVVRNVNSEMVLAYWHSGRYLLTDLKAGKLTHQDIGQMDSYVRLFEGQCTAKDDNPTVGLILCAEKNSTIAKYSVLRKSKQLFAAKVLMYLPSEEELRHELDRERALLDTRVREKR